LNYHLKIKRRFILCGSAAAHIFALSTKAAKRFGIGFFRDGKLCKCIVLAETKQ